MKSKKFKQFFNVMLFMFFYLVFQNKHIHNK